MEETQRLSIQQQRIPWWLWPQVLALDAPLVAVTWHGALAKAHNLALSWEYSVTLFLATWVIYLLDRSSSAGELPGLRHHFCSRHRGWIYGAVVPLITLVGFSLALFRLPSGLVWNGLALQLVAMLYLWLFALRPRTMQGSLVFSLVSVSSMVLVSSYPITMAYRLMISVLIVVVMACGVLERISKRYRIILGKPLLSSLLFTCGTALSLHFWQLEGGSLFGSDAMLLWGLAVVNLATIAKAELKSILLQGDMPPNEAIIQRLSLSSSIPPLCIAILGYSGYRMMVSGSGAQTSFFFMTGVSVLLLMLLQARTWRCPVDTQHLLADLALLLPGLGYLMLKFQTA